MSSMREEKTEGIVLRALDYKDRQKIITVFTVECGLISLIVKGISRRALRLLALTSPFCRAEFHFARGRSDLYRFIDGTVLDENLSLRQKYSFLETAGRLAHAVLRSQLPGKPSPALYALFSAYLKQAPLFEQHQTLTTSFLLKMLKHEGLISLEELCLHCNNAPSRCIDRGESLCSAHAAPHALRFTDAEWALLFNLASAQNFSLLQQQTIEGSLEKKILQVFDQRILQP